jgi:hypothetical protein
MMILVSRFVPSVQNVIPAELLPEESEAIISGNGPTIIGRHSSTIIAALFVNISFIYYFCH